MCTNNLGNSILHQLSHAIAIMANVFSIQVDPAQNSKSAAGVGSSSGCYPTLGMQHYVFGEDISLYFVST